MHFRILSSDDVREALPMVDAIKGMKSAYEQLSTNKARVPLRTHMALGSPPDSSLIIMPAYLAENSALAVKVASIFPGNTSKNEPVIYGSVLVLDCQTGRPTALLEGSMLTAIRTGAGSGAATDVLATENASVLAILGSGVQARTQLEAVCTVRNIREVRVYSPNRETACKLASEMQGKGVVPRHLSVMPNAESAVRDADIICAATSSSTPVLDNNWLKPGAHLNGIGSYLPTMQEIDVETVKRALVVVDSFEAALAEAGDLFIPLQAGIIDQAHFQTELGEIVAGLKPGRTDPEQTTFFKSVGVAVQDVVAGQLAVRNASSRGLGTVVNM